MNNNNIFYIDATTIGEGGGYILLEYIANFLIENEQKHLIFCNERIETKLKNITASVKKPSFKELIKLYTTGFKDKTLFFCNRGPIFHNKHCSVYIHSEYATLSFREIYNLDTRICRKLIHFFTYILNFTSARISKNKFLVQTQHMRGKLFKKRGINSQTLPFFPKIVALKKINREFDYCYISFPWPHKNFQLLLSTLLTPDFSNVKLKIAVTIPTEKRFDHILQIIDKINSSTKHYVHNFGSVEKKYIPEIYSKSKAALFLSSKESFGIPLIEAAQLKIPILAPNLPYAQEILQGYYPVSISDPEIFRHELKKYSQLLFSGDLQPPKLVINNRISDLIY